MNQKMNVKSENNKVIKITIAFLIVLSFLAAISKALVGFDIDEAYAVSMPYRLFQGDILFLDMWEIHQTSSFFTAFLMKPFLDLAKSTTGIVLYLRVVSACIHLFISVWIYFVLKKEWNSKTEPILVALLYFNFLPKWLLSADFSMQLIWFFTTHVILIWQALHCDKEWKRNVCFFLSGVSLAFCVLGYVTMLIIFPISLLAIWKLEEEDNKEKRKHGLFMVLGCFVCAILFFIYLFSHMSPSELFHNIPYLFSDASHQFQTNVKWILWFGFIKDVIIETLILGLPTLVITILLYIWDKKYEKIQRMHLFSNGFFQVFLFLFFVFTSLIVILARAVGLSWGPFRLQIRYLAVFVFMIIGMFITDRTRNRKAVTYLLVLTSLAAFAGILLASNVGPTSSSSYLVLGLIAYVILLLHPPNGKPGENTVALLGVAVFILSLIFCKGFYIRVTEYPPADILEERVRIEQGPAKGIYVYPADYERMSSDYVTIQSETTEQDKMLFMGTESLNNLYGNGTFVSPTTISTPAFDEAWIEYFTLYEEKQPTIIFLAKNTVDDREKFFAKNPFGIWIAQNYDVVNRKETDSLCIIRR